MRFSENKILVHSNAFTDHEIRVTAVQENDGVIKSNGAEENVLQSASENCDDGPFSLYRDGEFLYNGERSDRLYITIIHISDRHVKGFC